MDSDTEETPKPKQRVKQALTKKRTQFSDSEDDNTDEVPAKKLLESQEDESDSHCSSGDLPLISFASRAQSEKSKVIQALCKKKESKTPIKAEPNQVDQETLKTPKPSSKQKKRIAVSSSSDSESSDSSLSPSKCSSAIQG